MSVRSRARGVERSLRGIRWNDRTRVLETAFVTGGPRSGVAFASLSVGDEHACGVREADGDLECWGLDNLGRATPDGGPVVDGNAIGLLIVCGSGSD